MPSTRRAPLAAVLCALGLIVAVLAQPDSATAMATPGPEHSASSASGRTVDLAGDTSHVEWTSTANRTRAARANPTWPRGTIRYYETVPAKWQWGLDQAISHWNGAGGKVRFVKVGSRERAQVTVGYGNTHGYDGYGTWNSLDGKIVRGKVTLARKYQDVDHLDDEQRVWVGRLLTHELGHVLGFDHTRPACSLMVPYFDFDVGCGPLSTTRPGYFPCRWIDAALLKRFIRLYGGRARRPAAECLVYPRPPALTGVEVTGGAADGGGPVTISWSRAGLDRLGAVRIAVWPASACGKEPADAEVRTIRPGTTTWVDPVDAEGTACYRAQSVNHSGIGRTSSYSLRSR